MRAYIYADNRYFFFRHFFLSVSSIRPLTVLKPFLRRKIHINYIAHLMEKKQEGFACFFIQLIVTSCRTRMLVLSGMRE